MNCCNCVFLADSLREGAERFWQHSFEVLKQVRKRNAELHTVVCNLFTELVTRLLIIYLSYTKRIGSGKLITSYIHVFTLITGRES